MANLSFIIFTLVIVKGNIVYVHTSLRRSMDRT